MKISRRVHEPMRISFLADQFCSSAGGGRFARGLLNTLLSDPFLLNQIKSLDIVVTQNEPTPSLGRFPIPVAAIRRRFPARLRGTPLAAIYGYALPVVDVAFGPFYYVFPCRAKVRVVTVHDLSCFDFGFHPRASASKTISLLTRMVHSCDGFVCDSDSSLNDFVSRWPILADKAVRIYPGISHLETAPSSKRLVAERTILTVGTIEPRKNYSVILDAYERLSVELGDATPKLAVIGNLGWMSDGVANRLIKLQAAGKCIWLRNASDEQLADAYANATVFTYMSVSEGFGYPPFEAALARCPMVLSSASSVGEIWADHARCVDPRNIGQIISSWKWALSLSPEQKTEVVSRQLNHANKFSWQRAALSYLDFWRRISCAALSR